MHIEMKESSSVANHGGAGIAADILLPKIYQELRCLAARQLRRESGYQTLQPTALVHEAWVRISGETESDWKNNQQFVGVAAIMMRRILVERARGKATLKRTAPDMTGCETHDIPPNDDHLIMIHECLTILEKSDPDSAKVVLLKFYGGFSNQEIAKATGWSLRTVERQWMFAKAKLYRLIRGVKAAENP